MLGRFGGITDCLARFAMSPAISEDERKDLRRRVEEGRAESERLAVLDVDGTDDRRAVRDSIRRAEDCLFRLHISGLELAIAVAKRSGEGSGP